MFLALLDGRERTRSEYAELFARAGLELEDVISTHSPMQIVTARLA